MATLWFDLENSKIDDELYEDELLEKDVPISGDVDDRYDALLEDDEYEIFCPQCGELIEDGVQCPICGFIVEM